MLTGYRFLHILAFKYNRAVLTPSKPRSEPSMLPLILPLILIHSYETDTPPPLQFIIIWLALGPQVSFASGLSIFYAYLRSGLVRRLYRMTRKRGIIVPFPVLCTLCHSSVWSMNYYHILMNYTSRLHAHSLLLKWCPAVWTNPCNLRRDCEESVIRTSAYNFLGYATKFEV